ncbi:MAG TPA: 3-hydroxyacyl-CoA dehydrogenase NAD-binding domain-containing protein [Polyangiaceae bacterium]|nr:3-hydroxyacyl-CoA dehydrogenase NAD-binding domain-containing protein [Polyangiaceae bacterium]
MQVKLIGVVGAGQMGSGIAQLGAQSGFDMLLMDQNPELAQKALARIERTLGILVEKGKLDDATRRNTLARIQPAPEYGALAECDLIIEAATEHAPTKCEIFRQAEAVTRPDAILASNTSSISITALAASTKRPERVIGIHFMNPPPIMRLVEIIRGLQTSDATAESAKEVSTRMGKVIVSARDMPGFIVNRMLIPFLNEACFALQEGLGTPEDIDTGAKLGLNHPMGPLELADLIGLDTVLSIAEVLHRELGDDKYRPPTILRNHVSAGWLGRKSGRGFYHYPR